MCMCACEYVFVCVFVCMNMFLFACFTNYNLPIVHVSSNVQRGSVYKYFTSTSTFSHSLCDIMNLANYDALLTLLDLLLCLQFTSHYNSHDLLHLISY